MNIRVILFALMVLVVGIVAGGIGVMDYQNQRSDIQEAVQVEGTVEDTDVDRRGTDDDYFPQVRYTYSYEGQRYTSTKVYPGSSEKSFNTEEQAEEAISQYSPGETTTVYVNQDDPSSAYLIQQTQTLRHFMAMGAGLFCVVAGVIALYADLS